MKTRFGLGALIVMLGLLAACGGQGGDGYKQDTPAAVPEKSVKTIPPVAALIVHRVSDYDAWKIVFDEHMQARKDASIVGHHLNRGADDPNMVYLYFPATNAEKLEAFLGGDNLKQAMKLAGVEGAPTIHLMKPMSEDFIRDQMLPGIIVMHPVEDYDRWRAAYDAFDAHRVEVGIVGHAVTQALGNPNQLFAYHQANDMETLRTFVDSVELKETMQNAGVIGAPDIRFVQVADFGDY